MSPSGAGWPSTPQELSTLQAQLATARPSPWEPGGRTGAVGASACSFEVVDTCRGEQAWAAASRCAPGDLRPEQVEVVTRQVADVYSPGQLALREGPLREAAVCRLDPPPDVLLVNATGRDHPRRAGLALHLGTVLDLPTVGVTDRPLVATGDEPGAAPGARAPLLLDGEVVGYRLRTRGSIRPIVVHAGWRTTPEVAVEVVLACVDASRTPEPLRHARRAARVARARAAG